MYWLAVSSKLIRFVLHFSHKCCYHINIKCPIKKVVRRSVIYSLVPFLFFCKIHNSLLVIIIILLFYPFYHCRDSPVVIFCHLFRFVKSSVSQILFLCSAWMLTFNISGDATLPAAYIGTLGALCRCRPPPCHGDDCNICVTSVGEPFESRYLRSHGSLRDSLKTPLDMYK